MSYFVLTPSGDGGWSVETLDKERLEKYLAGLLERAEDADDQPQFLEAVPDIDSINTDECWPIVIIQGDVLVPRAVDVVKRYMIEE